MTPGQIGVDLFGHDFRSHLSLSRRRVLDEDLPHGPYGEMNMGGAGKIHVPPGSTNTSRKPCSPPGSSRAAR